MIQVELNNELYQYNTFHIIKAFYPNEEIKIIINTNQSHIMQFSNQDQKLFQIEDSVVPVQTEMQDDEYKKLCKHEVNLALYHHLVAVSHRELEWGMLNGVRPTKVAMKKWKSTLAKYQKTELESDAQIEQEVVTWLNAYYGVKEEKAQLAVQIAKHEQELLSTIDLEQGYSLYVGIPFCKTRCTYCSFTAYPLDQWVDRMDEYLDALCTEIRYVASVSKDKYLNTIYVGGGTPTSLSASQLDRLLTTLEQNFSYEHLQEITVEAGRPDTITREKLEVIKSHGIERISINPQTMQDKTLERIGRKHSVQEFIDCYYMARELGFANINMDLIMGLPGETIQDVENTLAEIEKLNPDSLTVHTLAMKRTSQMTLSGEHMEEDTQMKEMIKAAEQCAQKMEMQPYYLYRQKNIVGNYENVGYAKVDKAGIYNILIMEEKQSIVAVGAGSTTKIVLPIEKNNIIRIENYKNVELYIAQIDEMIQRKGEWLWH